MILNPNLYSLPTHTDPLTKLRLFFRHFRNKNWYLRWPVPCSNTGLRKDCSGDASWNNRYKLAYFKYINLLELIYTHIAEAVYLRDVDHYNI